MKSDRIVLLPQPIEKEAAEMLTNAGCKIVLAPNPKPETVAPLMRDANAIVLRTGIHITRELLSGADELRIISRTGGGLDNVDVNAATEREIVVTSNVGVNSTTVIEHVVTLMMSLTKRLFVLDSAVRGHNFGIRYKNLPGEVRGKTLGLMGFGRIGSELGRLCHQAFNMNILAYDPVLPDAIKAKFKEWVRFVDMDTLFSESDVISVHTPLTPETHHVVGERMLSRMKPSAFLINTSRGPVVDEAALIRALKDEKIAGAGLDVFTEEPIQDDNPLLGLKNTILTPHTAALTTECVVRMATEAAQCVIDLFDGKIPPHVANRQILTSDRWKHLKPGREG